IKGFVKDGEVHRIKNTPSRRQPGRVFGTSCVQRFKSPILRPTSPAIATDGSHNPNPEQPCNRQSNQLLTTKGALEELSKFAGQPKRQRRDTPVQPKAENAQTQNQPDSCHAENRVAHQRQQRTSGSLSPG